MHDKKLVIPKKTFYNLLRHGYLVDLNFPVQAWQIADLRLWKIDDLLEELKKLGLTLTRKEFALLADPHATPEEFVEALKEEMPDVFPSEEIVDRLYLVVFELWRKLFPEKKSISIFADELDTFISLYEDGKLPSIEPIEDRLDMLMDSLEEEDFETAQAIYQNLQQASVHSLDQFLYDFISDQIEMGVDDLALDLIEGFEPYVENKRAFTLLRIYLLGKTDPEGAEDLSRQLLETQKQEECSFFIEWSTMIVGFASAKHFLAVLKKGLEKVEIEEDLLELLATAEEYFERVEDRARAVHFSALADAMESLDHELVFLKQKAIDSCG